MYVSYFAFFMAAVSTDLLSPYLLYTVFSKMTLRSNFILLYNVRSVHTFGSYSPSIVGNIVCIILCSFCDPYFMISCENPPGHGTDFILCIFRVSGNSFLASAYHLFLCTVVFVTL